LVFSVGADHDSVTLVGDAVALEEPEPLVAPLDELLELDVEVTGVEVTGVAVTGVEATGVEVAGVEVTGVEATGVEATGVEVEATGVEAAGVEVVALGVLLVPVVGSVPVLAGGVTAAALLASLAELASCVEPPHPDSSRPTAIAIVPIIRDKGFQHRSIFMCIASLMGKGPKKRSGDCVSIGKKRTDGGVTKPTRRGEAGNPAISCPYREQRPEALRPRLTTGMPFQLRRQLALNCAHTQRVCPTVRLQTATRRAMQINYCHAAIRDMRAKCTAESCACYSGSRCTLEPRLRPDDRL